MDEIVVRGLAKWPNVPAVYGWLSLDSRGNWLIKGERIGNPLVTGFIGRNYLHDERGCWYFQNGPQRVFVNIQSTPLVLRIVSATGTPLAIEAHTGRPVVNVSGAWIDENGTILLETELGPGTIHDRDLEQLLPHLIDANGNPLPEPVLDELMVQAEHGKPVPMWLKFRDSSIKIEPVTARDVPRHFGFVAQPEPPAGEEVCR